MVFSSEIWFSLKEINSGKISEFFYFTDRKFIYKIMKIGSHCILILYFLLTFVHYDNSWPFLYNSYNATFLHTLFYFNLILLCPIIQCFYLYIKFCPITNQTNFQIISEHLDLSGYPFMTKIIWFEFPIISDFIWRNYSTFFSFQINYKNQNEIQISTYSNKIWKLK